MDDRAGVIAIEASAPVAYVAAQPDPQTFVIELRDVLASGFADNFTRDPRHPFSAVRVESAVAADGIAVARVSMALTEPLRPRVRSSRNVIYVEADRLDRARTGASGVAGPASALLHISAARRGPATAVTLTGSGRLTASRADTPADGTPRLVLDLANATSAVPRTTAVGEGPVDKVRIGLSSSAPLMTQVVMDLTRRVPYRLETSPDGHELTVVFDPPSPRPRLRQPSTEHWLPRGRPRRRHRREPPSVNGRSRRSGSCAAAGSSSASDRASGCGPPEWLNPSACGAGGASSSGASPDFQPAGTAPQKFTGFPISLDFQGADLRAVLRTFAEISGLNIVIDPSIQGTVDVALRDVPWDQALDIILRANRLGTRSTEPSCALHP